MRRKFLLILVLLLMPIVIPNQNYIGVMCQIGNAFNSNLYNIRFIKVAPTVYFTLNHLAIVKNDDCFIKCLFEVKTDLAIAKRATCHE